MIHARFILRLKERKYRTLENIGEVSKPRNLCSAFVPLLISGLSLQVEGDCDCLLKGSRTLTSSSYTSALQT